MKKLPLGSAIFSCALISSGLAAKVPSNLFWVSYGIQQGMTEAEFESVVAQQKLSVTYPIPNQDTKAVTIGDATYWLDFCDGRLTYASWFLDNNDELIKSMDERVNRQGFRLADFKVSSSYSDGLKKDLNQFSLRFEHPEKQFSVTYDQFSENGQVHVEDTNYDDTYNCVREGS